MFNRRSAENLNAPKDDNKMDPSRRDFLGKAGKLAAGVLLSQSLGSLEGFAQEKTKSDKVLDFADNDFLKERPWIETELNEFLKQQEASEILGFDLSDQKHKIKIAMAESSVGLGLGTTFPNGDILINGFLFSDGDPRAYLLKDGFSEQDLKQKIFAQNLELIEHLRAKPALLKLYRDLTVAHEISHAGHKLGYAKEETGHGVTDRTEIRLATALLKSGKITPEAWEELFSLFSERINSAGETPDEIEKYKKSVLNK